MKKFAAGVIVAALLIFIAQTAFVWSQGPRFHATPLFSDGFEVSRTYTPIYGPRSTEESAVRFLTHEEWTFQNATDTSVHIEIPSQQFQVETVVGVYGLGWRSIASYESLPEKASGISFDIPATARHVISWDEESTYVLGSRPTTDNRSYTIVVTINGVPKLMVTRFQPTTKHG